jgi:hypothetical protein
MRLRRSFPLVSLKPAAKSSKNAQTLSRCMTGERLRAAKSRLRPNGIMAGPPRFLPCLPIISDGTRRPPLDKVFFLLIFIGLIGRPDRRGYKNRQHLSILSEADRRFGHGRALCSAEPVPDIDVVGHSFARKYALARRRVRLAVAVPEGRGEPLRSHSSLGSVFIATERKQ